MNQNLGSAFFDSKIRSADCEKFGAFAIGEDSTICRRVRKPNNISRPGKVSTLAFFLKACAKKQLKAAYATSGKNHTFLIEKNGTYGTWRAITSFENNEVRIVSKADEFYHGEIFGISIGLLLVACEEFRKLFPVTVDCLENGLAQASAIDMIFDAAYYEAIEGNIKLAFQDDDVETAFTRSGAFEPIRAKSPFYKVLFDGDELPGIDDTTTGAPSTEEESENAADPVMDFYRKCLAGDFRKFTLEFEDDTLIPPLETLQRYYPSREFMECTMITYEAMCQATGKNYNGKPNERRMSATQMANVPNFKLSGPPGCGKSEMPRAIAAALGLPVYQFTVSGGYEENDFDLKPTFNKVGTIEMVKRAFRKGFEKGGIVIMDEFNVAKPEVLTTLNGAIESPYILGNGETAVHRSPMTIVFATCNPGAEGTREQNPALHTRFQYAFSFESPTEDRLRGMVAFRRPDIDMQKEKKNIDAILNIYQSMIANITAMVDLESISEILCFRSINGTLTSFYNVGLSLGRSIEISMINSVLSFAADKYNRDRDTMEEIQNKVIEPALARAEKYYKVYAKNTLAPSKTTA